MIQQIIDLEIDALQANPLQPRGIITPESLVDLVDSIKEHGILEPLVIAKTPAGFQIIAGERRWRASKLAGMKTVPVIIKETSPQGMLEMAIVENVQRSDLNAIDRAKAFERLLSEFTLSNSEIAQRIGKSPAYVSNSLRLLSLPDALKDGLLTGLITEGHARTQNLKTHLVEREYQPVEQPSKIDKIRDDIENALGGKPRAQVKLSRSRAETRLLIVLKGNVEDTEEKLQRIYKSLTS